MTQRIGLRRLARQKIVDQGFLDAEGVSTSVSASLHIVIYQSVNSVAPADEQNSQFYLLIHCVTDDNRPEKTCENVMIRANRFKQLSPHFGMHYVRIRQIRAASRGPLAPRLDRDTHG